MKIELGMYVRYADVRNIDKIAKVISIIPPEFPIWEEYYRLDNGDGAIPSSIIKADDNLINLIEEGDYVNGHPVTKISKDRFIWLEGYNKDRTWTYVDFINEWGDNIKSIVTKEQFESLMYEVE